MKLEDILPKLTAWFPPSDHKDRKLPGGGKWFFVNHQTIRDRLNEVCPGEWSDEYRGPIISGDYVVMFCKLTICGVTHEGVADDKTFPDVNDSGKAKIIGSPVVNATRHAFRDAAEKFGICAYLDDQKANQRKFVQYMSGKGDGRAYKEAHDNGWLENEKGETVKPRTRPPENTDLVGAMNGNKALTISEPQIKRLWAIARGNGYTDSGVKVLIQSYKYNSSKDIQAKDYDAICAKAGDKNMAPMYNSKATADV